MPRHPHVGEGGCSSAGFIVHALSGNPPKSLLGRLVGGVLAPGLLLAFAARCWVTAGAGLPKALPAVGRAGAVAVGIACLGASVFLACHCLLRNGGVAGALRASGRLVGSCAFIVSAVYVGVRAVSDAMG